MALPDTTFDLPADLDGILLSQRALRQQLVQLLKLPRLLNDRLTRHFRPVNFRKSVHLYPKITWDRKSQIGHGVTSFFVRPTYKHITHITQIQDERGVAQLG